MRIDKHGIIRNPGKFEGEHQDILYWHDLMMNGNGNDVPYDDESGDICATWFDVTEEDREKLSHPDKSFNFAVLSYSDYGFVYLAYYQVLPNELEAIQ